MNRREFFRRGVIGGVVAAAAVQEWPFRVFSFPSVIEPVTGIKSMRFIKAYDPIQMRTINRFDMLYGFGKLEIPGGIDSCSIVTKINEDSLSRSEVESFINQRLREYAPNCHIDAKVITAQLPGPRVSQAGCRYQVTLES